MRQKVQSMTTIPKAKSPASRYSVPLQYRVYSDLSEIKALSRQWDALLSASACNKAFGSLEWYLASCHVQGSLEPYLLTATQGPEITGVLPLALDSQSGMLVFPHCANDYNDVVVRRDSLDRAAGLLEHATSLCKGRRMFLAKLRPDSDCARAAALFNGKPHLECRFRKTKAYSYIELPASFDDYLASRSRLSRRNVKYALRKTEANGLVMRELSPREFDPMLLPEMLIRFAIDRQDEKSFFRLAYAQAFVREVLPSLFIKGYLKVFAMLKEGKAAAMDFYFFTHSGLTAWNGGFMPEIERLSPGTALLAFAIRQAIAMGFREFDFGEGDEAYKKHWTNKEYVVGEMELVPRTSLSFTF
jgi:CelD/BcsL family acetyltransferase involved in cellulose biosynthesis